MRQISYLSRSQLTNKIVRHLIKTEQHFIFWCKKVILAGIMKEQRASIFKNDHST
jgi:hypothetical protein